MASPWGFACTAKGCFSKIREKRRFWGKNTHTKNTRKTGFSQVKNWSKNMFPSFKIEGRRCVQWIAPPHMWWVCIHMYTQWKDWWVQPPHVFNAVLWDARQQARKKSQHRHKRPQNRGRHIGVTRQKPEATQKQHTFNTWLALKEGTQRSLKLTLGHRKPRSQHGEPTLLFVTRVRWGTVAIYHS